jgi:hypothetical protein
LLRPIEWDVPPPDMEKFQESSADHHSSTYPVSGVGVEGAGVDLHIGTTRRTNCSALLSWMSRPGNWSTKKVQELSVGHHPFTYVISGVGVEGAGVDHHIGAIPSINCSSVLEVVCGAPGIGARRTFRNVLQTSTHTLTVRAVLVSKAESWTTRVPSSM